MKKLLIFLWLCSFFLSAHGEPVVSEEFRFFSHSTKLSGTLVSPKNRKPYASVVFVHGSGAQTRNLELANNLARAGIVTFVYDKRGVGRSGGKYESKQSVSEKNIRLLADDAVAAMKVLESHPKTRKLKKGLIGISQAGWIVPIAAHHYTKTDFIVLWSGPVCKVSEEDIYSKHTADHDGANLPSYEEALGARKVKYVWPEFLGEDIDPRDSLAKMRIPGLWIFGSRDGSIPVDLSIKNLETLIHAGHAYSYINVAGVGHNNIPETIETAVAWISKVTKQ